jgi:hypothetical protein
MQVLQVKRTGNLIHARYPMVPAQGQAQGEGGRNEMAVDNVWLNFVNQTPGLLKRIGNLVRPAQRQRQISEIDICSGAAPGSDGTPLIAGQYHVQFNA